MFCVSKMGRLQDWGKFHNIFSGNGDCDSAHCCGYIQPLFVFCVSKMSRLQDWGKLGKFHNIFSGNVCASDCGSTHCSGCVEIAFL